MHTIVFRSLFSAVALLTMSNASAELWDMREKSFGSAIAREDKTADAKFEGTKLFLDGR